MTNLLAFKPANPFVCIGLEPLCRLFLLFSALVSFVFNRLQPLFPKHPGWGYLLGNSSVVPKRKNASLQVLCLPLLRTLCRVSPFLATLTKTSGMGVSQVRLNCGVLTLDWRRRLEDWDGAEQERGMRLGKCR